MTGQSPADVRARIRRILIPLNPLVEVPASSTVRRLTFCSANASTCSRHWSVGNDLFRLLFEGHRLGKTRGCSKQSSQDHETPYQHDRLHWNAWLTKKMSSSNNLLSEGARQA